MTMHFGGPRAHGPHKGNIKANFLSFLLAEGFLTLCLLTVNAWRFSVGYKMTEDERKDLDVGAAGHHSAVAPAAALDDLTELTACFTRFHSRYCDDRPRSPEELRIIRAPLGFEPN